MKKFSAIFALALACVWSISASAQSVTPNAGLQIPSYSQLNWQVQIIYDLTRLDNIFGGSVAVPSITLSGPITNANQAATKAYVDSVAQGYLQASGATMTGPLVLAADPTAPLQAATKQYVDNSVAAGGGTGSLTSTAIDNALGFAPQSATDVSNAISASQTLTPSYTTVTLSGAITNGTQAATKAYVDNAISGVSSSAFNGGTLTQPLILAGDPTTSLGAATKEYVDSSTLGFLPLSGGQMSGDVLLHSDPTQALQAATKGYVDAQIAAALGSGTGGTGGTGGTFSTGIGTVNRTGVLTDGTVAYKTCFVGSSVCSGGVGSNAPSSTPVRQAGLSSPNASTGTANAVASYSLSTSFAQPNFTDVLWTTTGGGLGADSTSTNWYRDFWMKAAFPSGHTHFEFDTYDFASGWDWMWGTQCNATKKLIQYDNQNNGWVDTSVSCGQLFDGNWHHIQQTFHRDLAGSNNCAGNTAPCQWWDDIAIDGTLYVISKSLSATTSTWSGSGGQIQLDTEPTTAPATATVYVDTDIVTAGLAADSGGSNPGGNGGNTSGTGELGSFNFDGSTPAAGLVAVGSPAISSSNYHTSPNSLSFPAGNNYEKYTLPSATNVMYTRQYVYFSSQGSNALSFLRFYSGGQELFVWYISTGGVITAYDQATASDIGSGYTMPMGSLHLVETYTKISSTAGQVIVKVDGTVQYTSAANLNTGSATIDTVWFGGFGNTTPAGWGTTYMDNVDFSALGFIGPI
jgi:hypothetical protein